MAEPLNIIYACPRFLWAGGGSVYLTRRMAESMVDRGHRVSIFTDEPEPGTEKPGLRESSYTLRTFPRDRTVEEAARKRLSLADRRGMYRLSQWLFRSGRLQLRAEGPWCPALGKADTYDPADVVCFVNTSTTAFAELGSRINPLMDETLNMACPLFHPREALSQWPVHAEYHRAFDEIHTLTAFESDWMQRTLGVEAGRLHELGSGDDAWSGALAGDFREQHGIPADAPVVLFLGRKVYNKGVVHVIEAMERVWREQPEARLVLIGFRHNEEGWIEGHLDRIPGARERTVNLDDVDEQTREEALAACTLMAAPSINDSFGIVYLNAWRHARPVIACRDTCCESTIRDGGNGFLVGFGAVEELAVRMLELIDEPARAAVMGQAGFDTWETEFQWPGIAERLEAMYREGLQG